MTPTQQERAYLLRCAKEWDRVAVAFDGPETPETILGLCCAVGYGWGHPHVGRAINIYNQAMASEPSGGWWPYDPIHRTKRAAHARKLAARCRTLAAT